MTLLQISLKEVMPRYNPEEGNNIVPREIITAHVEHLHKLMQLASTADIPYSLEFDTGRYVNSRGEVMQRKQGYKIMVGPYAHTTNGKETLFSTLGEAAEAGLQMLHRVISDQDGRKKADDIFSRYFNKIN
jgi:hypothetical protein